MTTVDEKKTSSLPNALPEYIRISHYATWNDDQSRLETWGDQVHRVMQMHETFFEGKEIAKEMELVRRLLLDKRILGSQRSLQFGGEPILKKHERLYNCAATYLDRPRAFQEILFLLLCGTGCGFSVQLHHVAKLPGVQQPAKDNLKVFAVPDTIEGWADTIGILLSSYFVDRQPFPEYAGCNVVFDLSQIRAKGSKISHITGTAPGPAPLQQAIDRIRSLLAMVTTTRQLRPIECYDIVMHFSDAVLAGGVRRSANLCIFSPEDPEMRKAKTGNWFQDNPQRARSNNSMLLLRDDVTTESLREHISTIKQFGEPGLILGESKEALYNPCVEIGLAGISETGETGFEMCNLTTINMKKATTKERFLEACEGAAILGTMQAAYTNFPYLGKETESIVRREALLGVSQTGMADNPKIAFDPELQRAGATVVKATNKMMAAKLGIKQSARTTCIKPEGSSSCLLATASGIHPHHARRYFRRVQVNRQNKIHGFFKEHQPVAVEPSVWSANGTDDVLTFLFEVPESAEVKADVSALDFLEKVRLTQENWVATGRNLELCAQPWLQHNVSNTISVGPDEWEEATEFIAKHKECFSGISLLAASGDMDYAQAPFQAVLDPLDIVDKYGAGAMFASGLIIHALQAFDNNLFNACAALLGFGALPTETPHMTTDERKQVMNKQLWVERAEKFSKRYFAGDNQLLTYCLKAIDAFKRWCDIKRDLKPLPWMEFLSGSGVQEEEAKTDKRRIVACSGGSCEITRI